MKISRRSFISFVGAFAAGLAVKPSLALDALPEWVEAPEDIPLSLEPDNDAFATARRRVVGPAWLMSLSILGLDGDFELVRSAPYRSLLMENRCGPNSVFFWGPYDPTCQFFIPKSQHIDLILKSSNKASLREVKSHMIYRRQHG